MKEMKRKILSALLAVSLFVGAAIPAFAADKPVSEGFPTVADGQYLKLHVMTEKESPNTKRYYFFAGGTPIVVNEPVDSPDNAEQITEKSFTPTASISWTADEGTAHAVNVPAGTFVIGGGHNIDEKIESTSITMEGGTVNAIVGGGLHKCYVGESNVQMNGGAVSNYVQGGGAHYIVVDGDCQNSNPSKIEDDVADIKNRVDKATVTVTGGTIKSCLYGGGESYSYVGEAILNIEGDVTGPAGKSYWITAGGSNGYTKKATLNIKSGDLSGAIVQGINRGKMDDIEINVSGGTVGKLFVGGETAQTGTAVNGKYQTANVTITGGTVTNLYPGSNGTNNVPVSTFTALSAKVTDGTVTNFHNDVKGATSTTYTEELSSTWKAAVTKYYSITSEDSEGGSITIASENTLTGADGEFYGEEHKEITVTATPDTGYELSALTWDDTPIENGAFTMPGKAVTVAAVFKKQQHTVTFDIDSTLGKAVDTDGNELSQKTVNYGDRLSFKVEVTNDDYKLGKVYQAADDTTTLEEIPGTNGTYSFAVKRDVTVGANFTKKSDLERGIYAVTIPETVTVTGGLTDEGDGPKAKAGDTVKFTVAPPEGKKLAAGYPKVPGATVTKSGNSYSFKMPKQAAAIEVVFIDINHKITVISGGHGTAAADKETAELDEKVTLTVKPDIGYTVDNITVKGVDGETVPVTGNAFAMPEQDVKVHVAFRMKSAEPTPPAQDDKFRVSASAENATVVFYTDKACKDEAVLDGGVARGTVLYVKVLPDVKSVLDLITVNGNPANNITIADGAASFPLNISRDTEVSAKCKEIESIPLPQELPAEEEAPLAEGATILSDTKLRAGTVIELVPPVKVEKGNVAAQLAASGVKPAGFNTVTPQAVLDINIPNASDLKAAITFKFDVSKFALDYAKKYQVGHVKSNGKLQWLAAVLDKDEETLSFTLRTEDGFSPFVLAQVSNTTIRVSGGGGGGAFYGSTDGMPITATSGPNGSISPAGETKVEFGKDFTFTVTPDAGYVVDKVIVDGIREVQLTNGKYTFQSVDQPYTIEATFKCGTGAAAEEAKPAAPAVPSTPAPNPQTGDGLFDHLFDSFLSFLL